MKKKTEEKLKKRWKRLPLHFIDTSVILEVLLEGEYEYDCKSFLNQVGYKYRGLLSVLVLGEITKGIFKIQDSVGREMARNFVDGFIIKHKVDVASLSYETLPVVLRIKELNSYIKPMDALHVSCAVESGAGTFVTLDKELIRTKREIENEYEIRIKEPSEL